MEELIDVGRNTLRVDSTFWYQLREITVGMAEENYSPFALMAFLQHRVDLSCCYQTYPDDIKHHFLDSKVQRLQDIPGSQKQNRTAKVPRLKDQAPTRFSISQLLLFQYKLT